VHRPHQQQQVVAMQQLLASPSGHAAAGVSVRGASASRGVRQPARRQARAAASSKKTNLGQTTRPAAVLQQLAARGARRSSRSSSSRETGRAGALALSAPAGRVEVGARGRSGSGARRALRQPAAQRAVRRATVRMAGPQTRLQAGPGRTLVQGLGRVAAAKVQAMVTGTAGRTAVMAAVMLGVRGPSVPRAGAGVSGRSGSGWQHGWQQQQRLLLRQLRWTREVAALGF
jgi:hypothetical protein